MAYVILINDDDTLYGSKKTTIMQRSNLVEELIFITHPIYRNSIDMTNASVMLEYVLPISKEYKTVNLTLCDERYEDCYLQYKLPFKTDITKEHGRVELQLTFAYVELDQSGNPLQRVRKTSSTYIDVVPITAWSDIIPDQALSALDQRIIKLDSQMKALGAYAEAIDDNMVDNLKYNDKDDTLQLTANGNGVGDKVSIRDMLEDGVPVVDLNSSDSGDSGEGEDDHNGNCEDNVVEFGYEELPDNPNEDDNGGNVVEF